MAEKIFVWVKEPEKNPRHVWVSNTLENLQRTVGGMIEFYPIATDFGIICNEEGKLLGLPDNFDLGGEHFVGTCIFVGVDGENFASAPTTNEMFKLMFPELYRKEVNV